MNDIVDILWHMEMNELSGSQFAYYVNTESSPYYKYPYKTLKRLVREGFLQKTQLYDNMIVYTIAE